MQKVVYMCDACKQVIGEKKHISLRIAQDTGIAVPPSKNQAQWAIHHKMQGNFLHFCNGKCIGAYFKEIMDKVKV